MSNTFISFFNNGWKHIVDLEAYDHLLFVMTLCAAFTIKEIKSILIIVTAFTIGHCLTLILCAFNLIPTNPKIIDKIIPLTIMLTSISNVYTYNSRNKKLKLKYLIALIFGLIHGLAFAGNFTAMMFDTNIILPLFSFNLGIEIGQIFIVSIFILILFIYTKYIKGNHLTWNTFISGAGFGIAGTIFLNSFTQ